MRNRLVPRTEWTSFFGEFSRRYQGWLVTVRILSPAYGSQVEARDLPLEGVVPSAAGPISLHLGGFRAGQRRARGRLARSRSGSRSRRRDRRKRSASCPTTAPRRSWSSGRLRCLKPSTASFIPRNARLPAVGDCGPRKTRFPVLGL